MVPCELLANGVYNEAKSPCNDYLKEDPSGAPQPRKQSAALKVSLVLSPPFLLK